MKSEMQILRFYLRRQRSNIEISHIIFIFVDKRQMLLWCIIMNQAICWFEIPVPDMQLSQKSAIGDILFMMIQCVTIFQLIRYGETVYYPAGKSEFPSKVLLSVAYLPYIILLFFQSKFPTWHFLICLNFQVCQPNMTFDINVKIKCCRDLKEKKIHFWWIRPHSHQLIASYNKDDLIVLN